MFASCNTNCNVNNVLECETSYRIGAEVAFPPVEKSDWTSPLCMKMHDDPLGSDSEDSLRQAGVILPGVVHFRPCARHHGEPARLWAEDDLPPGNFSMGCRSKKHQKVVQRPTKTCQKNVLQWASIATSTRTLFTIRSLLARLAVCMFLLCVGLCFLVESL